LNVGLLTGASASGVIADWVDSLSINGLNIKVQSIVNNTFGSSVTVAGLMCGKDILKQLSLDQPVDLLLIPDVAVRSGVFLDDVTIDDLNSAFGCRVVVVEPSPQSAARAILEAVGC
jgi:NifB/MoaA-like Fe-S oxidoreductase